MIEPEALIDPEAVAPVSPARRRRRAVIAGVTVLSVLAGAIAMTAGGGSPEAKPLALMSGSRSGGTAETMAAPALAPAPGAAADSKLAAPYPSWGWGLKFEVDGQLPGLPDHATAWRVSGPALDQAAVVRIAGALGLTGTPVQRDGGWFVESGDWTLSAFGGGDAWSINVFRSRDAGRPDDTAGAADDTPAGPALSPAEAERRVQDLLDRMGAPSGSWEFQTTETEIGVGWACAAPVPAITPELTKEEADKLRQIADPAATNTAGPEASATATSSGSSAGSGTASSADASTRSAAPGVVGGPTPADKPVAGGTVPSCPPPPAPVRGFNVAVYPVLDGRRADWAVWNVTLRSDGRVESLYGSWVTFERGGNYKLRGVDAALKELESPTPPPVAFATDTPAIALDAPAAIEPAPANPAAGDAGQAKKWANSAGSSGAVATTPGVAMPAIEPVCPPVGMPLRAQDDKATAPIEATCVPPAPQVVKITGVELGLMQASVFGDGRVQLALVPAYRFVGHFDNGTPWETSVIALHPDAIAPPPDFPIVDDVRSGGGTTGKAVPPTPSPEPAIVRDNGSTR